MTGSLKTRLLLRLTLAQAGAMAVALALFPLVTPYVDYVDIADSSARHLLERALERGPDGGLRVAPGAHLTRYLAARPGFSYAILDPRDGRAVAGSAERLSAVLGRVDPYLPLPGGSLATRGPGGEPVHVETVATRFGALAFATSGNTFRIEDVPSFVDVFLPAIGPMFVPLLLGALVAVPLVVRRSLRPLDRAAREAAQIDLRTLDRRLSNGDLPREFEPLVRAINDALDRLDEGVRRQQRYSANAAHEMRTPVAVLQARVDALPEAGHKQALRADVQRLAALVEQLLAAARLGQRTVPMDEDVDIAACVRDVVADRAPLAVRGGRQIAVAGGAPGALVRGNQRALSSAVANLIDNALRAEPEHGTVEVGVTVEDDRVRVGVMDHGHGIEPADRDLVFEPFWRKDERPPGTGLGLSIVKEIALLHGGTVRIDETPGGGARFTLELPSLGASARTPVHEGAARSRPPAPQSSAVR